MSFIIEGLVVVLRGCVLKMIRWKGSWLGSFGAMLES